MVYCIDWWNAWWFVVDSSIQMNIVCIIWLRRLHFVLIECAPSVTWKGSFRISIFSFVAMLWFVGQTWKLLFLAFYAEYYMWCSDWLQLLLWLAAQNRVLCGAVGRISPYTVEHSASLCAAQLWLTCLNCYLHGLTGVCFVSWQDWSLRSFRQEGCCHQLCEERRHQDSAWYWTVLLHTDWWNAHEW